MNRKQIYLAGVAVLLLVGGVLIVIRLMPSAVVAAGSGGSQKVIESVTIRDDGNGPSAPLSLRTIILPAPQLSQSPATASGLVLGRQDNRLRVGTGNIELEVDIKIEGEAEPEQVAISPSADGPEIEVVVTSKTAVYRDVTDFTPGDPAAGGERQIQQVVEPVKDIAEIGTNMEIQVWGERRGNEVVADVLVYGPLPLPGHHSP